MRIKKFEYSPQINWNENKINELYELQKKVYSMEKDLSQLLLRYLKINPHLQENQNDLLTSDGYIDSFDIDPNNLYTIIEISYYSEHDDIDTYISEISKKQYKDFLIFLKNPDMYEKSKKYNL